MSTDVRVAPAVPFFPYVGAADVAIAKVAEAMTLKCIAKVVSGSNKTIEQIRDLGRTTSLDSPPGDGVPRTASCAQG